MGTEVVREHTNRCANENANIVSDLNSYFADASESQWWFRTHDGRDIGVDDPAFGVNAALMQAHSTHLVDLTSGASLAALTMTDMHKIFQPAPGAGHLPLLRERLQCLREHGALVLGDRNPSAFLRACGGSAVTFVHRLSRESPAWRDVQRHRFSTDALDPLLPRVGGGPDTFVLAFYKRAQLCASILHCAGLTAFVQA